MEDGKMNKAEEVDDHEEEEESRGSRSSFSKPSWLLFTIAELDEKMKALTSNVPEEDKPSDTFAERAESYYRKRPQLLSLLRQLYNGYLSLADRYCQALAKNHHCHRYPPQTPPPRSNSGNTILDIDSDAESTLSYQPLVPTPPTVQLKLDADTIVAELVMKTVDYEIIVDELSTEERQWGESSRKIELQKSLLEVLESERLILLNENARLAYTAAELEEENKGLAAESVFMKMKAGELARCVLKMREDHRMGMLSRKIEDLQGQIYGLEKRNKEYYEQLVKLEGEKKKTMRKKKMYSWSWSWSRGEVTLEDCFQVDKETVDGSISTNSTNTISSNSTNTTNTTTTTSTTVAEVMIKGGRRGGGSGTGRRVLKMWDRVKNFEMFMCGPHFNSTCR
ncbi:hypothetical protein LguiA_027781 [Lonicera macranthoides]